MVEYVAGCVESEVPLTLSTTRFHVMKIIIFFLYS